MGVKIKESSVSTGYFNASFKDDPFTAKIQGRSGRIPQKPTPSKLSHSGLFSLFRFSNKKDRWITIVGVFFSIISACLLPTVLYAYAELINVMVERTMPNNSSLTTEVSLLPLFGGGQMLENATHEEKMDALIDDSLAHLYASVTVGVLLVVTLAIGIAMVKISAVRQVQRIRKKVFTSILRHDMTWFDVNGGRNVAVKMSEELVDLEEGIGGTFAIFLHFAGNVMFAIGISLYLSWKLSLVVGSILPINLALCIFLPKYQSSLARKETHHIEKAGVVVNEALTNIRTVMSFGGEAKEVEKYSKELETASKYAIRRAFSVGFATAVTWGLNLLSMSISFIYGANLLSGDEHIYSIIAVMALIWISAVRFSSAFRLLDCFIKAKAAGSSIFSTIDAPHGIDPDCTDGMELKNIKGKIEFKDVHFRYAAREQISVFNGLSLSIESGQYIAIVGPSGAGKTTVLQLLQRFYDVTNGEILVDGTEIDKLQIRWWRNQVGVVGQEATLFSGTISENIRFGFLEATEKDIIDAAIKANAHNFIMKLPKGYDTVINSKGGTLSGGEKQRIAIARALIRNPKILLLDEPTSALDSTSRDIVQDALNDVSKGRTTVLVTHRFANLKDMDKIFVIDDGKVAEEGTFNELLSINGIFCNLLKTEQEMTDTGNKKVAKHETENQVEDVEEMEKFAPRHSVNYEKLVLAETLNKKEDISLWTVFEWNKPQLPLIILGFVMSACTGTLLPIFNIIYGELVGALTQGDSDEIRSESTKNSLYLLAILVVMVITIFSQIMAFGYAGERITNKIRIESFTRVLNQELGWFDDLQNHVGAICSRLSEDAKAINNVSGTGVAMMFQAIVNLIVGISFGFYYSWELTLAMLPTLPFLFLGPFFEGYLNYKDSTSKSQPAENASMIATEVVENKRVVTSLGLETHFMMKYNAAVDETCGNWKRACIVRGLAVGFGNIVAHQVYAIGFAYGAYLIKRDDLQFKVIVKVGELIVLGGTLLAAEFVFSPILSSAQLATARLQRLIQATSSEKEGVVDKLPEKYTGEKIAFSKVSMSYPTRPGISVLRGVDITIREGQKIGIVGSSGSGKSSILHLLQRLYEPTKGNVSINGVDIMQLTIPTLRSHMGLVSQEPVLFSGTIRENIAYGDNTREVSMDEIVRAAKGANIHTFIASLPLGYETKLGAITQLSGGQKQRIAIARALVRNPKVLLLDEATSALDPESEKVVQDALNKASESRTTITIAHRPGAVACADTILTLKGGCVVDFKERSNACQSSD